LLGTSARVRRSFASPITKEPTMRGILLWLIGIPIPIIILLWLFGVLH
jgi:hypothetical protein